MARRVKTRTEIAEWHQEFARINYDWCEWLRTNQLNYTSAEEAWMAYKIQRPGKYISIPGVEAWFEE